jgi:hypothetical protein
MAAVVSPMSVVLMTFAPRQVGVGTRRFCGHSNVKLDRVECDGISEPASMEHVGRQAATSYNSYNDWTLPQDSTTRSSFPLQTRRIVHPAPAQSLQ